MNCDGKEVKIEEGSCLRFGRVIHVLAYGGAIRLTWRKSLEVRVCDGIGGRRRENWSGFAFDV